MAQPQQQQPPSGLTAQQQRAFLDAPTQYGPNAERDEWAGARILGEGGQGCAALFLRQTEDGTITDRMVDKCVLADQTWMDPLHWQTNAQGQVLRLPREVAMQQRARASGPRVVLVRSYKIDDARQHYHIYMNYYPHGSLVDLIKKYTDSNHRPLRNAYIPPQALWHILLSLAHMCSLLELPVPPNPPNLGRHIVHMDIKPANIFLDEPHATYFPQYPRLYLGDFGSAFLTNNQDPHNPGTIVQTAAITQGYTAPEQWEGVDWQQGQMKVVGNTPMYMPNPLDSLGNHTNVWQCGQVMNALMTLTNALPQPDWTDGGTHPPNGRWYASANYPVALRALVRNMLDLQVNNRMNATALINTIIPGRAEMDRLYGPNAVQENTMTPAEQQLVARWRRKLGMMYREPLRRSRRNNARAIEQGFLRFQAIDDYAIGLSLTARRGHRKALGLGRAGATDPNPDVGVRHVPRHPAQQRKIDAANLKARQTRARNAGLPIPHALPAPPAPAAPPAPPPPPAAPAAPAVAPAAFAAPPAAVAAHLMAAYQPVPGAAPAPPNAAAPADANDGGLLAAATIAGAALATLFNQNGQP